MLKELLLMKCRPGKTLNTPEGLSISPSPSDSCLVSRRYNIDLFGLMVNWNLKFYFLSFNFRFNWRRKGKGTFQNLIISCFWKRCLTYRHSIKCIKTAIHFCYCYLCFQFQLFVKTLYGGVEFLLGENIFWKWVWHLPFSCC